MSNLGIVPKTFVRLGETIGESQKLVIEKMGSLIVTPAGMYFAPGIHTKKDKDEIKYQMLYTPVGVAIGLVLSLALTVPIANRLHYLAMLGKLSKDMQPTMMLNVLKVNNVDDLLIRLKLKDQPNGLKTMLIDLYDRSLKIFELTSKKMNQEASILLHSTTHDVKQLLLTGKLTAEQTKTFINKIIKIEDTRPFQGYKLMMQWVSTLLIFPVIPLVTSKIWPLFVKSVTPSLDKSVRDNSIK